MEKKQSNRSLIIGGVILVVVIAALLIGYILLRPATNTDTKELTITVVNAAEEEITYTVTTNAEFLRQAMDEADGLSYDGSDGNPSFILDTINDETASYENDNAYWAFFVNEEYCNYGIDEQPIADGDSFRIVYTIG